MKDSSQSFRQGLLRTKTYFFSRLGRAFLGRESVTEEMMDEIEEALLSSDVDLETTQRIISGLSLRAKQLSYFDKTELLKLLKEEVQGCLSAAAELPYPLPPAGETRVVLLVGVNGVGKTTTAARLAYGYQQQGASVVLGAADTFRAAAIDQLEGWGQRLGLPVVAKNMGSDPSAVAYATLTEAKKTQTQVAIIDTAGRLHNKKHLMEELAKLHRVMGKVLPRAPHEVLLVLDASVGQNAFAQAEAFREATQVTGLVLTKLDGTAKGGVLIGLVTKFGIPVRYVGLGEGLPDLLPFKSETYVDALFAEAKEK